MLTGVTNKELIELAKKIVHENKDDMHLIYNVMETLALRLELVAQTR